MKIKDLIKRDAGFHFVVDNLEMLSTAGRRCMMETDYETSAERLEDEWEHVARMQETLSRNECRRAHVEFGHCLMQLHDIHGTLQSLASHTTLNEIELFELKNLSLISRNAGEAISALGLSDILPLPNLEEVFAMLDHDRAGIASFYIYDSYHHRLPSLRKELRELQIAGTDQERIASLIAEQNDIQRNVCIELTDRLVAFHDKLLAALDMLAYADFLLAKAKLVEHFSLSRPTITDSMVYTGLVNLRLRQHNIESGLRYQPVDFATQSGVCLITGANMAGKTVLLKSLSTAQFMVQCGMYAPALSANVMLFDDVVASIGDGQNEMNGLSSYASEIITISNIIERSRKEHLLILIDEPARTTNPVEGKALVRAIVTILDTQCSVSLITTHYSQLATSCRRLRVRGFVENMSTVQLSPNNINLFVDYSLIEDDSDNVPHEAIRIASILGCDSEMISFADSYIDE